MSSGQGAIAVLRVVGDFNPVVPPGVMPETFTDRLLAALPALRRFALSLCRAPDVADDLVQITVERALASEDRYDPVRPLNAWLFRILRNAWIDMQRRAQTRGVESDIFETPEAASTGGPSETDARVMLNQTLAALDTLPEDQRAVLSLVCMEELSYAETAAVLDVPVGTVMSRLARGRKALARKMGMDGAAGA